MDSAEKFKLIINSVFEREQNSGLYQDPRYRDRLDKEIKEIETQMEQDYFLDLFNKEAKFAKNENNLFIAKLLRFTEDFDLERESEFVQGEYPDIDVDFNPIVRDHLKNIWAPKTFGEMNVCAIGNYTTFGIKSSLIDMARVYGLDRNEILSLTTKIGLKDEDGKALTWDKALESYPDLKKYCDENSQASGEYPSFKDAARRLLNRNRGMGMHAGGLIIANQRIDNLVPLVKGKDGVPVSAFVEGLHGTDLGPLGLVKFDMLVITNLVQISKACKLIKDRHGLSSISALPGKPDWSDISYLNDPKALKMADSGKLKCIFQFDSEGIRELVRRGGVTSFEDLVAYSSIYRPGPLGMKMDDRYIERKRGREEYTLHPVLSPILSKTYGVMIYQEQVMKILRIVGDIPDMHCEIVRKAISKKKVKIFGRYKEMFIKNGQRILGWTEVEVAELWSQIESFSEYGFNRSILKNTLVPTIYSDGSLGKKYIQDFKSGDIVLNIDENGRTVQSKVVSVHNHGVLPGFEIEFDDGCRVTCTMNHKFLTKSGQKPLHDIIRDNDQILSDVNYAKEKREWLGDEMWNDISESACEDSPLPRMQNLSTVCDRKVDNTLWRDTSNKNSGENTSEELREVSLSSLEDEWGSNCRTQGTLWRDPSNIRQTRRTSQNVRKMQRNQEAEYSCEESQNESIRRTQGICLTGSNQNFCSTRNSSCTSSKIKGVERCQSGEACRNRRENVKESQTIQNGSMASSRVTTSYKKSPLWQKTEMGRFCKKEFMDRSGWLLPFLREQMSSNIKKAKGTNFVASSKQRCNVEQRSYSAKKDDVNQSQHGMFCEFNGQDERRLVCDSYGYAKITDTGSLVPRKIVRILPVGRQQMYDLEVASPTHNFLLSNGIVTSNSHSVAYSMISARLLYLKAHYPLEFFAAIFSCEDSCDKVKDYKHEAMSMGIELKSLDINKSKMKFDIVDDQIYMGFANIKGIGDEIAERIVKGQPYASFQDFLERFGTEAKVLKPLIALRCFKDDKPAKLYEYYEYYKAGVKKVEERNARFVKATAKLADELRYLLPEDMKEKADELLLKWASSESELNEFLSSYTEDSKDIQKVVKKYIRSSTTNAQKNEDASVAKLEDFEPSGELDSELKGLFCDVIQIAENQFYGFSWNHLLESSPDYQGKNTFIDFDEDEYAAIKMCELHVTGQPQKIPYKNGKGFRYLVKMEDANSKEMSITFWEEDFDRFKEELEYWENDIRKGNFLRCRLRKPEPPFKNYTFESPSKNMREREVPKEKSKDYRLQIMARPTILEETEVEYSNTTPKVLIDFKEIIEL